MWLAAASRLASGEAVQARSLSSTATGLKRHSVASGRVPERLLARRRISQVPPYKCPLMRKVLWDWFVDIVASVASMISPKFMLLKARENANKVLK